MIIRDDAYVVILRQAQQDTCGYIENKLGDSATLREVN